MDMQKLPTWMAHRICIIRPTQKNPLFVGHLTQLEDAHDHLLVDLHPSMVHSSRSSLLMTLDASPFADSSK
jgi:hypothetical protein